MQHVLIFMRSHEPGDFLHKGVIGMIGSVLAAIPSWIQDAHQIALFVGSTLGAVVAFLSAIGLTWGLWDKWRGKKK